MKSVRQWAKVRTWVTISNCHSLQNIHIFYNKNATHKKFQIWLYNSHQQKLWSILRKDKMSQTSGAACDTHCVHLLPLAHIGDQIWRRLLEDIFEAPHIQHMQLLSLFISYSDFPISQRISIALHSSLRESPLSKNTLSIFLRDKYGMHHILLYHLEMNRKIQMGQGRDRTSQNQI